MDYKIFYKENLSETRDWEKKYSWDVFISSYTAAERTTEIYNNIQATEKYWLVFPEFEYNNSVIPADSFVYNQKLEESEFIMKFWEEKINNIKDKSIVIDITGFIRPYL